MSTCQAIDPFVTPYIDGELGGAERRLVDDHMRACPPCRSRLDAERAVRDLIAARQKSLASVCAPDSLRTRCGRLREAVDDAERTGSPAAAAVRARMPLARRAAPLALAASLVLLVGLAFLYQATDRSERVMAAELTADHLKCFALNAALGTHQEASTVEAAMLAGFGWRMHLPDQPSRAGLELVGSRPCLYGEGRVAHIMYRHHGQPVSLFMLPRTERSQELVQVLGHEAAIWCDRNRTFVLIAREPPEKVQQLAAFVRTSMQ